MNGSKPQDGIWREEDVEAVLRDFFRAEMPADLRELAPATARATATPARAADRRTGRISLLAASAVLCVAVTLVLSSSPSGQNLKPGKAIPTVTPVVDLTPPAPARDVESRFATNPMLIGHRNGSSTVTPVELRKYVHQVLVELGILDPEPFFEPDIEQFPIQEEDEEGTPKSPKGPQPAKKN